MRRKLKPIITARCDIPFNRKDKAPSIARTIRIEREMPSGDEKPSDLYVNISIAWIEGDRRDKDILAGIDRRQNVFTDVCYILDALISLFPELLIKYTID